MKVKAGSWGKEIAIERVGGIAYRMYVDRPRRIESLLPFADNWPDRAYVIQGERTVTRKGLQRGSAAKAKYLLDNGVKRGDRVVVLGWNSPDLVLNVWACLRMGSIPVFANPWWSDADLTAALDLVQPALILADGPSVTKLAGRGWRLGEWQADENASEVTLPKTTAAEAAQLSENDPSSLIFTSGTSGRAKAVLLAHRSQLSNQMMLLHVTRNLPYVPDELQGDVGLHTGPLFHIGGLQALMRAVLIGNTLVFAKGRFEAGDTIKLIEKHRIVRWSAVPTMAARVLEHPDLGKHDVSSLTAMTLGGSAVPSEFFERVRKGLPSVQARIATGYGLSENGGQATTASGKDTIAHPGTCGRAMPLAEIKVIPAPGLPDGEIVIRSPTQMLRYYGIDETPIDAEGWLHTGDLGKVEDTGFVWITGRSKEIIIRGGENIAPAAVEAALARIPGVSEVAVFGMPHAEFGEEVMAVVVVDNDETTADSLKTQLRDKVVSYAVPSLWLLQKDPLPVNQTGKVDKNALRARILTNSSRQMAN